MIYPIREGNIYETKEGYIYIEDVCIEESGITITYIHTVTLIRKSVRYMTSLDLFVKKLLSVESNLIDGTGDIHYEYQI